MIEKIKLECFSAKFNKLVNCDAKDRTTEIIDKTNEIIDWINEQGGLAAYENQIIKDRKEEDEKLTKVD